MKKFNKIIIGNFAKKEAVAELSLDGRLLNRRK